MSLSNFLTKAVNQETKQFKYMHLRRSQWNWLIHKFPRLPITFVIVLHLAIALPLATLLNIWIDEAYSLHTTGKDITYAFNQAIYFELQPPLYFILLKIWRHFNDSIFFARLFSIICVVTAMYLTAILSQRFIKDIHPAWVVAAVALNPLVISSSIEIRLYAFLILLSALLLLFFFDGYLAETTMLRARCFYITCSILALYTQYYAGFLLIANGFALLVLRRWRVLRHYIFGMSIVGICFAPMLLVIPNQVSQHTKTVVGRSWLYSLKTVLQRVWWYTIKPEFPLPEREKHIIYFVFSVLVLMTLWRKHRSINSNNIAIWSITILLSLSFIILVNKFGDDAVNFRHSCVLFLPSILSVFSILSVIARKYGKKLILIWTLVILSCNSVTLYINYQPMAKDGDYARVASYIMAFEKPDQPILAFSSETVMTLAYYYSGINALVPLPKAEDFQTYDINNFVLNDEKEIWTALSRVSGKHQYIWLVTYGICDAFDIEFNCNILENFVNKYYFVEADKGFFKSRVRLLRRKQNHQNIE